MADIIIILALIVLNGLFSLSELAVVQAKRQRLDRMAHDGSAGAAAALDLHDDPSRFLSTVQVGITLISIFNGAFGEASLVARFTPAVASWGVPENYARSATLAVVVIVITFVSIVIGELVPKRVAMLYPETLAVLLARPVQLVSRVMLPFVKLLSLTTDFFMRLLGMHRRKDDAPTEEDVTGMIKESTEAGVFEKTEYDIAARALRLDDWHLRALMTPRIDLEFVDLDEPLEQNLARIADSAYGRFPVFRGDRSQVVGIVSTRSLFAQAVRGQSLAAIDLDRAIEPILYVPESVSAIDLLEQIKKHRAELAMIVDEYGDIQGMITLTDVMNALVGEVASNESDEHPEAVRREDGSWLLDGGMVLDRFRHVSGATMTFPDEALGAYHTLAGFILYQLAVIPKVGEQVLWADWCFEVLDMDGNRIDKLLARYVAPPPGERDDAADDAPARPSPWE